MRGNRPARERFEFSLDARQVASVILGALAALGITFFLGYSMGQRVLERPPAPAPAAGKPADSLAALDRDGGGPVSNLSFHDTLTGPRAPPDKLPVPPPKASAPAVAGRVSNSAPAGAVSPVSPAPVAPVALARPAAAAPIPEATAAPATSSGTAAPPGTAAASAASRPATPPTPRVAHEGAFFVQIGSTQDRFEAERLAIKFRSRGAKVTSADVPGKGRWYRVRIGGFESREAADRSLHDLDKQTGSKAFVTGAN